MPRNGSGDFELVTNSWQPAVNGVLATAGDWQSLINDVAAAITQSVSRDGQSPLTGNLQLGNNKITGVTAGAGTGEALAFQQLFNQGTMADIASAATTDIGAQNTNFLRVTGNTTITSFGSNFKGPRFLVFESSLTLTNSSTLVLPGGANITTAAGDVLIAIPGATLGTADKWIVAAYQASTGYLKSANPSYTGTLTGGTGVVNFGSGQFYKDASGNVGIGTSSPAYKFQVAPGDNQLAVFNESGTWTTNGGVVLADYYAGTTLIGGIKISASTASSGYVSFHAGGTTERGRFDTGGNLLVGTTFGTARFRIDKSNVDGVWMMQGFTDGAEQLRINNSGSIQNALGSYGAISDAKLKENVDEATPKLAKLNRVRVVNYNLIGREEKLLGVVAQELEQIFPGMVEDTPDRDEEGNDLGTTTKSVKYSVFVPMLIKAIQEQQAIITDQDTKIGQLVDQLTNAESTINLLTEMFTESQQNVTALTSRIEKLEST